ncbi:TetR/AcrR family transcriptional regulator [Embleya sp. NPDC001921]
MTSSRSWRSDEVARNDRALLKAAREVIGEDGAHASVASIAARAGVGVGTLYRRYRTKQELFQRLCEIALGEYLAAARTALDMDDPWDGIRHYAKTSIHSGPGSLAPIAGTIEMTDEMNSLAEESDGAVAVLVERGRRAGVLREGVSAADLELLIEQLSTSPLVEHLNRQGRTDLMPAARQARERIVDIALDGLRATPAGPVTGPEPGYELFTERWNPHPRTGPAVAPEEESR